MLRRLLVIPLLSFLVSASPGIAETVEIFADGEAGRLAGTLERPDGVIAATALILPGSGPTDRNGNSLPNIHSDAYRLMAEALADEGIATARIDKRGVGESEGDGNAVSLASYRADTEAWIATLRAETGAECIWLIGHSEGAIHAILAEDHPNVCGLVLLAPPGRRLGDLVRDQLAAQPLSEPLLPAYDAALEDLLAGGAPDLADLPPGLLPLFSPAVRDFFRELASFDPATAFGATSRPAMLIHGDADMQVPPSEAAPMVEARPDATSLLIGGLSHMLKTAIPLAEAANHEAYVQANWPSYLDPSLPLHEDLIPAVSGFILSSHD